MLEEMLVVESGVLGWRIGRRCPVFISWCLVRWRTRCDRWLRDRYASRRISHRAEHTTRPPRRRADHKADGGSRGPHDGVNDPMERRAQEPKKNAWTLLNPFGILVDTSARRALWGSHEQSRRCRHNRNYAITKHRKKGRRRQGQDVVCSAKLSRTVRNIKQVGQASCPDWPWCLLLEDRIAASLSAHQRGHYRKVTGLAVIAEEAKSCESPQCGTISRCGSMCCWGVRLRAREFHQRGPSCCGPREGLSEVHGATVVGR
ncbi:hypothetical protein EJ06DRAFT_85790 [Trichodelitschia bisporula]|uniref:Uncharacterized protein n=1 Tax=Trichodelitschia bisporula TaxID=703511 RepID=A0A6G1HSB0_9PEZI|nr:hypothetical protein EJ06DRAFT_85790 [Trichodelitschia bisporula]